jgi:hypothetical protein
MGPVLRDRTGGGLLQRLVGEQPAAGVGEFRGRLAAQQRGFDQGGRSGSVAGARRADVGEPVGQRQRRNIGQSSAAQLRPQVTDRLQVKI